MEKIMGLDNLDKRLREIEPITFIAINENMGFYFDHHIFNMKDERILGINPQKFFDEKYKFGDLNERLDLGDYHHIFRKPVYKKYFGVYLLDMEKSHLGRASDTRLSSLRIGEDCEISFSKTYEGISKQLENRGFNISGFVKRVKEEVEPKLREKLNLDINPNSESKDLFIKE